MGTTASNGQNVSYHNPYSSPRQSQSTTLAVPSVSEFTNNPEGYPRFVLVTVLSTGKMQVMTRAEAYGNRKVKIVSNPNEATSVDSGFFAQSPRDEASCQGLYTGHLGGIQVEYVFALDMLTGLFVVVTKLDVLREPWRYRVFVNM